MTLKELYMQIENPLDNKAIKKLIEIYSKSSNFYTMLTQCIKKETTMLINKSDKDRFYVAMFNQWKNNIVSMTKSEFAELYRRGSYNRDFVAMRNYLKTIPDVSTKKEADEILHSSKPDKVLEEAIDKYRWDKLGELSGWTHICSRYVRAKKDKYPNVEHRLYLDTNSTDTYNMVNILTQKFNEHKLPYYFKFDEAGNRSDTIVIYSSTEDLLNNVKILEEIKKEHPDLVSKVQEPPLLTGKIDGWIGYGSEPHKVNGEKTSFNMVRSKAIEKAIEKSTKEWTLKNKNMEINYKDKKVLFSEYLADVATAYFISKLEDPLKSTSDNMDNFVKCKGYTPQDLQNPHFRNVIHNTLSNNMDTLLTQICNGKAKDVSSIKWNVRNNKTISFTGYDLEELMKRLSNQIVKHDSSFIDTVKNNIKIESQQYGIDTDKYCFDKDKVIRMQQVYRAENQTKKTEVMQTNNQDVDYESQNLPMTTSQVAENKSTEDTMTTQEQQNLLSVLSQAAIQKAQEEKPTIEEPQQTEIDNGLDSYVMLEQSINQNPNLTDEQKAQARQQLWQDFDKYVDKHPEQGGKHR